MNINFIVIAILGLSTPLAAQDCPDTEKPQAVSFAKDIAPFVKRSCVDAKCHSTQRKKDGVDMETYEGAKKSYKRAMRAIKRRKMPIRRFPKLSSAEMTLLQKWAKDGFAP